MRLLSLTLPGYGKVETPKNIPSGDNAVGNAIMAGLNLFIILGVAASLIFTIYGGILWITSNGDKGKVDRARRTLTFSIVGLVVMILAFTIIQMVGTLLGVSLLKGQQP